MFQKVKIPGYKPPRIKLPNYKPRHDLMGRKISYRKEFKTSTRKRVWMKAVGHNPDLWRTNFIKTSKCMNPRCTIKKKLIWGDKTYEFDHKDNNSSNNSEKNCFLVCLFCHSKVTVRGPNKLIRDKFTGMVIQEKATKKKVGYKKVRRRKKQAKKTRTKRKLKSIWGNPQIPKIRLF